ncbi:MAG: hypothetical protein WA634_14410 [Silvibacterium sp.]
MTEILKGRVLKKAARACMLSEQVFDGSPQCRVATAGIIEKDLAIGWPESQSGLEQFCHQLQLTGHSFPSMSAPIEERYANALLAE